MDKFRYSCPCKNECSKIDQKSAIFGQKWAKNTLFFEQNLGAVWDKMQKKHAFFWKKHQKIGFFEDPLTGARGHFLEKSAKKHEKKH